MDFLEQINISTYKQLEKLTNGNGHIKSSIRIDGDEIKSLRYVRKIYGTLNLTGKNAVEDLGDLEYIGEDFWTGKAEDKNENLKSLGNLKEVCGDLNLRYSNVEDLGELSVVGGTLSLRDTPIENLGELRQVKKNLYLPKRLDGKLDLSSIQIEGKVKYWKDFNTTKIYKTKNTLKWDFLIKFGSIHIDEYLENKRKLIGKDLVQRIFQPSELNEYTLDNVESYFDFVDSKLQLMYGDKNTFYEALFNEKKSLDEINNEIKGEKYDPPFEVYNAPGQWYDGKKRNLGGEEIEKNSKKALRKKLNEYPFTKYIKVLNDYKEKTEFKGFVNTIYTSYNENVLGFCDSSGEDEKNSFKHFIEEKVFQIFFVWLRFLENEFRVSRGVPKIGEGWVSETDLYYKIKEALKPTEVIHHGKPEWLGRQHLDIWIPSLKIAIEYQGAQHDKPIEFFGGEEAFLKGQERDKKKKQLCKKNNVELIEVREGYDFEEILKQIKA